MRHLERSLALTATMEGDGGGVEFRQEADWIKLSQVKPEEAVTVLLATEYSIAIGYLSIEGKLEIEFMPWGQEENEDDELEFTHWTYLPAAPCWLRSPRSSIKISPATQLKLWS